MIGSTEEFRQLVADELATEPNPHIVAERILDKITGDVETMRIALSLCLSGWVATCAKRPSARRDAPAKTDAEGHRRPSPKAAGLVDRYVAKLNASVNIGDGVWKRLADCTVTDLRFLVDVRRADAEKNIAAADRYQALADALAKSRATTVGKLPRATGEAILF